MEPKFATVRVDPSRLSGTVFSSLRPHWSQPALMTRSGPSWTEFPSRKPTFTRTTSLDPSQTFPAQICSGKADLHGTSGFDPFKSFSAHLMNDCCAHQFRQCEYGRANLRADTLLFARACLRTSPTQAGYVEQRNFRCSRPQPSSRRGRFSLNQSLYLLPSILVVQSRRMISITVSVVRSR